MNVNFQIGNEDINWGHENHMSSTFYVITCSMEVKQILMRNLCIFYSFVRRNHGGSNFIPHSRYQHDWIFDI